MMKPRARVWLLLLLIATIAIMATNRLRSAEASGRTNLVLAFYYGWYDPTSFGPGITPFQPLYPYFSVSEATVRRQIKTAKAAGLDGFVMSWYGPNPNQQTEPNMKLALDLAQEQGFKMGVDFETASPFLNGNDELASALKTLIHTHGSHPAYLRMDGKPVIFFWANWTLSVNEWQYIRDRADPWNQSIWIAEGGHTKYLEVFDGLHLYNVAWSSNPAGINNRWAFETRNKADELGEYKYWVGTAMPGFDNSLIPGIDWTKRGRDNGSYLRKSFRGAAATNPDLLIVTSFNEWREGSNIEASKEWGDFYLNQLADLSADYKGRARGSFPAMPPWPAPPATATPPPPPTETPVPQVVQSASLQNSNAAADDSEVVVESGSGNVAQTTPVAVAAVNSPNDGVHVVSEGETLLGIAIRYRLELDALMTFNQLDETSLIGIGQELLLSPNQQQESYPEPSDVEATPIPVQVQPTEPFNPLFATPTAQADGRHIYTVQAGDTLVGIATRFGYSVDDLNEIYALNSLGPDDLVFVGQRIVLGTSPGEVTLLEGNIPPQYEGARLRESDNAYVHEVVAGDTLISIALKYRYQTMDAFYEVSELSAESFINIGQEVVVGYKLEPTVTGGSTDLPTTTPPPTPTAEPPTPTATLTPLPTRTALPFPTSEPTVAESSAESSVAPTIEIADTSSETLSDAPISLDAPTAQPPGVAEDAGNQSMLPFIVGLMGALLIVGSMLWIVLYTNRN